MQPREGFVPAATLDEKEWRGGSMTVRDVVTFAAPVLTFGSGSILLAYRSYAEHQGWATGSFIRRAAAPDVLAIMLMVFVVFLAWPYGWVHVVVAVAGGFLFSYPCTLVLRMWSQMVALGR
jgi:hypothetical protein